MSQLEPTVNNQTFDEMVAELRTYMSLESAIDIARIEFGLGSDTPVQDTTDTSET